MLRKLVCGCLGLGLLAAGAGRTELPAWWNGFRAMARLESGFVQQSDSAVFGKLRRQGELKLARGGRLRVEFAMGCCWSPTAATSPSTTPPPAPRSGSRCAARSTTPRC